MNTVVCQNASTHPSISGERDELNDDRAEATWKLRRIRSQSPMTQQELLRLHMLTNAIRIENGLLIYGMCRFRLRPTVAATLRFLIASPGEPIAVRRLCQAVYGHALTLRAIRQTAFRISRAMDNVNCPLAALCQAGTVFLRPKTWHFERGSPSSQ